MNQKVTEKKYGVFPEGGSAITRAMTHVVFMVVALSSPASFCATIADGKVKLSSFGSIGGLTTDTDEIGFKRNLSDPNPSSKGNINTSSLSNLGLQANFYPNEKLDIISQTLFHDQPEFNADTLIKILAVNYRPTPQWQIRLGRTPPRYYFRSDSHHDRLKVKATHRRTVKHTRQGNQVMTLHLRVPKYYCSPCQLTLDCCGRVSLSGVCTEHYLSSRLLIDQGLSFEKH